MIISWVLRRLFVIFFGTKPGTKTQSEPVFFWTWTRCLTCNHSFTPNSEASGTKKILGSSPWFFPKHFVKLFLWPKQNSPIVSPADFHRATGNMGRHLQHSSLAETLTLGRFVFLFMFWCAKTVENLSNQKFVFCRSITFNILESSNIGWLWYHTFFFFTTTQPRPKT